MFTSIVFTTLLASSAVLLSQATVTPNEPAPGDSFNEGSTCSVGWAGDTTGSTAWSSMSIELMTGSNEAMVHLSTVASGRDGTTSGTFTYTCPEVTPNSEIYFYQFTTCALPAINTTWTGRFTIAAADGSSTPTNQTEQSDGTTVSFGTGALVNPSAAVAAPTCGSTTNSASASGAAGSGSSGASATVSPATLAATTGISKTSASGFSTGTTSTASSNASTSTGAAQTKGSSAAIAVGPMVVDTRMWPVVAALTASAMAFTILL